MTTTDLKPVGDKILVRRLEPKHEKGQIILPESSKEQSREGHVVAMGGGRIVSGERIPFEVKVGDRIIFSSITGKVKANDEELLVMTEGNIIAIVTSSS